MVWDVWRGGRESDRKSASAVLSAARQAPSASSAACPQRAPQGAHTAPGTWGHRPGTALSGSHSLALEWAASVLARDRAPWLLARCASRATGGLCQPRAVCSPAGLPVESSGELPPTVAAARGSEHRKTRPPP
eukprot:3089015-Rhodomonas_salina.1